MNELQVTQVEIDKLKPAPYNLRRWSEQEKENLNKSIEEFGIVDPIIANSADGRKNIVIGGHFRLHIAKERGIKTVPVIYLNIPDEKKEKELNLRLNKNLDEWDYALLKEFDEEMLIDVGFAEQDMDIIFGLEKAEGFNAKAAYEKAVKEPRGVKLGDKWQLGDHILVVGDATDRGAWEKLFVGDKFDFMFTDPPYRLSYSKKRTRKVKTKEGWKSKPQREYETVGTTDFEGKPKAGFGSKSNRFYEGVDTKGGVPEFDAWLSIANDFQNPDGANVMVFENWRNTVDLWQAIEKYWKIRNLVIWHLPNRHQGYSLPHGFFGKYDVAPMGGDGVLNLQEEEGFREYLEENGQALLDSYEIAVYGNKGKSEHDKPKRTQFWQVSDHVTWKAGDEKSSGQGLIFGTKPVEILVPYIKILSPRGGIVAEPYGGSGSTIIASEVMKRKCRAIELSPTYSEVILTRWEKFTGRKAEKVDAA